jgi:choline dehydrogenase
LAGVLHLVAGLLILAPSVYMLEAYVRQHTSTTYHPVGTCKMGPATDPMAVVDAHLKVHGIDGLRVADASIIPDIIGGNTAAPSMMIGERAAAFILEGRQETTSQGQRMQAMV